MAKATEVRYTVRGRVGNDTTLGRLDLGDELVLVVRASVTKLSERYDDRTVVQDVNVSVIVAAQLDADALPATVRKALDAATAADGKLAL